MNRFFVKRTVLSSCHAQITPYGRYVLEKCNVEFNDI